METATRKTLFIMLGIMVAEAIPMVLTISWSAPGLWQRLYGFNTSLWPAWLSAAAVAIAYSAYAGKALPLIAQRFFDLHWLKLLAIPFAIISGTMEELWFRKQLMDAAANQGFGMAMQIVLSAALFGFVHAIWGIFARKWRVAVASMVATSVLGGTLAVVYQLAARNIAPCIWAHGIINLAIEPWLLFAAVSGRETKPLMHQPVAPG